MKVKIEDVAKLAGVSKTTVSRVLNSRGYLSEKTINKVHAAMDELNYRPNVIARQLFKQETKLVGLIFPTVNDPFYSQLIAEMEKRLFNNGFKVLIGDSMNDPKKEELYLQQLMAHQVDGLIVGAHNQGIPEYENSNLPIIAFDRIVNPKIPVISSDNYQGGKLATELLIDNGAKVIIHTNGPTTLETPTQDRRIAYQDVMKAHGLKPITYIIDFDDRAKKESLYRNIFKEHPDIDGMFTSNDMDASLVLNLATELGYKIPEDFKVVGYDGTYITRSLLPRLTTIVQPIDEMAETAVNMLMARIQGDESEGNKVFPVKIWRGNSV